ncbi:hypothetical protein [Nocardia aurantiaca]|uniref:Uncharacterized protein n=1 Tax=Nocardia aurantiaca TaxID=2675850 RepID=A0A6I3KLS5_9NOCA|nr:hypothetical protein [Nocardia aurantiaca]MTE11543.1 hypothetical protein [Nocardia aurantiaca]
MTTQSAARAQLLRHFGETLRALPAQLSLALRHPDLPKAVFHRGVNLPWDDSDPDNPLVFLDIRYWVLGTTPETSDSAFELVLRAWGDQGWPTISDPDEFPRVGYARTPDGFGFALAQSVNGYLSLAGSTPPFEPDSEAGEPLPAHIEHP